MVGADTKPGPHITSDWLHPLYTHQTTLWTTNSPSREIAQRQKLSWLSQRLEPVKKHRGVIRDELGRMVGGACHARQQRGLEGLSREMMGVWFLFYNIKSSTHHLVQLLLEVTDWKTVHLERKLYDFVILSIFLRKILIVSKWTRNSICWCWMVYFNSCSGQMFCLSPT